MLTADQQDIAEICSDPKRSNERSKHFELLDGDAPLLSDALLNIICRVDKVFEYHSHSLFVGIVQAVKEMRENIIFYS